MEVQVRAVERRATLVVTEVTTWALFPTVWPVLSAEVWACLRASGVGGGHPNVIPYLDDRPSVEVGVLAGAAVRPTGRVASSTLPAGRTAAALHRGSYRRLGDTHELIHAWCRDHDEQPTRTRWEIYGPHDPDPSHVWVEVSWLLGDP